MIYNVNIKATIESNLPQDVLESQLVIALYNVENEYSKLDGVDENLEVIDYDLTETSEICPQCEIELSSRMIDTDGTNLVEYHICDECGYGMPLNIKKLSLPHKKY